MPTEPRPPYWVVVYEIYKATGELNGRFTHMTDFAELEQAMRLRDEMIAQGQPPREVWVEARYHDEASQTRRNLTNELVWELCQQRPKR